MWELRGGMATRFLWGSKPVRLGDQHLGDLTRRVQTSSMAEAPTCLPAEMPRTHPRAGPPFRYGQFVGMTSEKSICDDGASRVRRWQPDPAKQGCLAPLPGGI
jgi:hypothetical protein